MTFPTTVWVLLPHDTKGNPRGFEKGLQYYFLSREAAEHVRRVDNPTLHVHECVLMSVEEWKNVSSKE